MVAPAIFTLNETAKTLAKQIAASLGGTLHATGTIGATAQLATLFLEGRPIVGICASGILIRSIAPLLKDKREEPPVIAVAEDGSSIVPLLGGHRGANALARRIATITKGHAAITTASDVHFGNSFDEPPEGHVLGNPHHMKAASAARIKGATIALTVTEAVAEGSSNEIIHHPQLLAIGVGCERGATEEEINGLIAETLRDNNLSPHAIACHASIDLKEDEPAISSLPNVRFFTASELKQQSDRIKTPSALVEAEVGTPSVAEAASLAAAGPEAELIVAKTKSKRATCAIARAPAPILSLRGRQRGTVHLVGIGPGTPALRSPAATAALLMASDWVGYGLYLDLAADCRIGQTEHNFPLGGEEDRCRHAIELAREGKQVALVCSGDAAIYAMAALVYELIEREPCRIGVEVIPGISAFQTASARAGALIGHDFCCISLSDLLTPWETIEQRLKAAAEGDFVISFYNPRSLKRRDQIERAFAILKPHRNPDTPVVLASSLGRPEEHVRVLRFDQFNAADVDMLTIVMVGSCQSRSLTRGDGKTYAFTPRGYAKKMDAL